MVKGVLGLLLEFSVGSNLAGSQSLLHADSLFHCHKVLLQRVKLLPGWSWPHNACHFLYSVLNYLSLATQCCWIFCWGFPLQGDCGNSPEASRTSMKKKTICHKYKLTVPPFHSFKAVSSALHQTLGMVAQFTRDWPSSRCIEAGRGTHCTFVQLELNFHCNKDATMITMILRWWQRLLM